MAIKRAIMITKVTRLQNIAKYASYICSYVSGIMIMLADTEKGYLHKRWFKCYTFNTKFKSYRFVKHKCVLAVCSTYESADRFCLVIPCDTIPELLISQLLTSTSSYLSKK